MLNILDTGVQVMWQYCHFSGTWISNVHCKMSSRKKFKKMPQSQNQWSRSRLN